MPGSEDEPRDEELMARFYACRSQAFDEVTRRWWKRLFGYFRRYNFSYETCEDLALKALVRLAATKDAVRTRGRFDVRRPLAPFLLTIARNLAIEEIRKGGPGKPDPEGRESDWPSAEAPPAFTDQFLIDLYACIDGLSEAERTYILLCGKHGLGDMSHTEIGNLLGKWPAQITGLSRRALAQLEAALKEKGYR